MNNGRKSLRILALTVSLFALWLLLSGIYKPLIIGFGVISSLLCVVLVARLNLLGEGGLFRSLKFFKFLNYLGWLVVEIGKADWAVTKVILAPTLPKRQRLIRVPTEQASDVGKALFANSITITPGTVTVESEDGYLLVHALTDEAADSSALAAMGHRVAVLERR